MKHFTATDAKNRFGELLHEVAAEPIAIFKNGREAAAALWEGLTMNLGFVDGNKRVGLACVYVFFGLNGVTIKARPVKLKAFIFHYLEAGTFNKDNLDAWLRTHSETA